MDHVHAYKFLQCQLFNLVALRSIKDSNEFNPAALQACDDAIMVTTAAVEKVLADNPSLEQSAENIVKSFEVTNG